MRNCPPIPSFNSLLCKFRKKTYVKNIFVGNLSFGATEDAVRTLFAPYGTISRVNIVTDRDTGDARGFAFVEMSDDGEGNKAIVGLNGVEFGGRPLTINEARPKDDRGDRGGQGKNRRW